MMRSPNSWYIELHVITHITVSDLDLIVQSSNMSFGALFKCMNGTAGSENEIHIILIFVLH